jgi:hypothetical protein
MGVTASAITFGSCSFMEGTARLRTGMRRRAQQVTLLALVAGGAAAPTPEEVHALQQHHQPHVDSAASSSHPSGKTLRYGGEVTHNMALWSTLPHHPLSSGYTAAAAAGEGEALRSITTLATKPSVPENFFWGNISGVSYLTPIRNQHIPTCASAGLDSATTSGLPPPRLVPSPLPSRCRCSPRRRRIDIPSPPPPQTAAAAGRLHPHLPSPTAGMSSTARAALPSPTSCSPPRTCSAAGMRSRVWARAAAATIPP